jgi:hypothetical protein
MPRSARVFLPALIVTLLFAVAGGVALAAHLNQQATLHVVTSAARNDLPSYNANGSKGANAITPSLPGQVPAFTEADVRAYYVRAHGFPGGGAPDGRMAPIQSITFMPREQAEAGLRGERLGLPAGRIVCVLIVSGPLRLNDIAVNAPAMLPGDPTPDPAKHYASSGQMVFDATTGDLIDWSMFP